MKDRYHLHLLVLLGYLLLSLALTWPLAAHFITHVPGSETWAFDEYIFIWNMWWFKFGLLDLGQSPLYSDYIFHPLGISLILYTFNFFNAMLGLPLTLVAGLTVASNTVILCAYVLGGYGTWLLTRYLLTSDSERRYHRRLVESASFIAGAVFTFAASKMVYAALGHYDLVTSQWFPFYALFFLKSIRERRWLNPVLAALFAVMGLLAEMIFGVFLLLLSLFLLWFELRRKTSAPQPASFVPHNTLQLLYRISPAAYRLLMVAPRLGVLGLLTALFWAPVMIPILRAFREAEDYALIGWGDSLKLSADLAGLFTPTALHPLWGTDWVNELLAVSAGTARFNDVNTLFLGFGITALALLGALSCWRQARAWFWSLLAFVIFSLGPLLTINGKNRFDLNGLEVTVPLPFTILHYIPVINANRVPNRFSVVISLAMAVLVAYAVYWLFTRGRLHRLVQHKLPLYAASALLLAAALLDQLAVPLPLSDARVPEPYYAIARDERDVSLLQLPLGWRSSFGVVGAERTQTQYYQSVHHKRTLGGNISRAPAFKFSYFERIPLFKALAETQLYRPVDPETLEKARLQAADLVALYDIGYLVIHEPIPNRYPYADTYAPARELVLELIPHEAPAVYVGDGVEVYRTLPAPPQDKLTIDFGSWEGAPYRGEGWGDEEEIFAAQASWTIAPQAEVFLPVDRLDAATLQLHAAPFDYPGVEQAQVLRLYLNEARQPFAEATLASGWQVVEVELPTSQLRRGLNVLTVEPARVASPREALPPNTAIGTTDVHTPVDLEITSTRDFAFMTVGFGDGTQDASTHRRGVNVAVIDAHSGLLLDARGFDTAANVYEAEKLAEYLATLEKGRIVMVATQGADALAYMTQQAAQQLYHLGAPQEIQAPMALIGVQGAETGSGAYAIGDDHAYLRLGRSADTRSLGVAVDWLKLSQ